MWRTWQIWSLFCSRRFSCIRPSLASVAREYKGESVARQEDVLRYLTQVSSVRRRELSMEWGKMRWQRAPAGLNGAIRIEASRRKPYSCETLSCETLSAKRVAGLAFCGTYTPPFA